MGGRRPPSRIRKRMDGARRSRAVLTFDDDERQPSELEQIVARFLDSTGVRYRTQVHWRGPSGKAYTVDFLVPSHDIIIEANGCTYHGHGCYFDRGGHKTRVRRDKMLRRDVEEHGQYTLVTVWACHINSEGDAYLSEQIGLSPGA